MIQKHPGQTKHICGLGLYQELQVCDSRSRNSSSKTVMFRLKNVLHANFLVLVTELAWTSFYKQRTTRKKNKSFPYPKLKIQSYAQRKEREIVMIREGIVICF